MGVTQGSYINNVLTFRDTLMSPPLGTSPWQSFPGQTLDDPGTGFTVYDDFVSLQNQATNGLWLVTKGTGGAVVLRSSAPLAGGWINIPTAASASDYQVFSTQQKSFLMASNMDLCFEAMLQITEAATNAASWFVGFTSTVTTGFLSSGVPASNYSGVVVYKTTGALAIKCQTSNATTQVTSTTLASEVSGTSLIVGAYINHNDNVTALVTPYISTVAANVRTLVAVGATQNWTIASLASMYFAFGVAAGSGGTAETLSLDYVKASQGRYYQ